MSGWIKETVDKWGRWAAQEEPRLRWPEVKQRLVEDLEKAHALHCPLAASKKGRKADAR